jgi:pimeloyl-ACP methyl ester carboxylesterase
MQADLRPFAFRATDEALDDLRDRLRRTRWPEPETVDDWSQGVPLSYLRELCAYWESDYDWRATERRLAELPQFVGRVDGLDVHFVHVRSTSPQATPVILTHGWPGSFLEFERVIAPLVDPAAHGGDPADACHVVVPSLPGYGFSQRPERSGWDVHRIARAWAELMDRLGHDRFLAAGSDWGTSISTSLALQCPDRLLGIHLIPPLAPPDRAATDLTEQERKSLTDLDERTRTGSGYSAVHGTRPQTIGYSLTDSPAGLAAWIVEKLWAWTDHGGDLDEVLSRDQVLDDITLYWLTGTGASSARLYWESIAQVTAWFTESVDDRRFAAIRHWGEPARGGHFGAWEQPSIFVDEVRAVARAVQGR